MDKAQEDLGMTGNGKLLGTDWDTDGQNLDSLKILLSLYFFSAFLFMCICLYIYLCVCVCVHAGVSVCVCVCVCVCWFMSNPLHSPF